MDLGTRIPGPVTVSWDTSGGRRRVLFRIDRTLHAGALSAAGGRQIADAAAVARRAGVPLVGVMATSGADVHEGVAALHGWGMAARSLAACSGIVPVVMAVTGPAVSGPALLLGLADVVAMTEDAFAYVSGPDAVASWTGRKLTSAELGGAEIHARSSGVASFVAPSVDAAVAVLDDVLAYFPGSNNAFPPAWPTDDPIDRPTPELADLLPTAANGSYDVRHLIRGVVDEGGLLELHARWAPNLVTVLATIGGEPVGIVAIQPQSVAGTLDIEASQKGARFVRLCDSFNLPLVTIVDTPGFFPGKDLEWRGMIRHGAQLAFAYAEASVPRVCLVTRKSYGGAYIVMDCKAMGNDFCVAWPSAEVAVMGAKGAVAILHRRSSAEEQAEREAEYGSELLTPWVAAERGFVDAVIDPSETRAVLARALAQLASKRETLPGRAHANGPL